MTDLRVEAIKAELAAQRATIERLRAACEYGAALLEKNAAMLDQLVMDTPEDQALNDRVVAVTRKAASLVRRSVDGQ